MFAPPMPVSATSMTPRQTPSSLRYSRRSACDRCRAYKLRCQRDERFGRPCERCAKSRLTCTTTATCGPAQSSASMLSSAATPSACQSSRPNPVPHVPTQQQNGNGQIQAPPESTDMGREDNTSAASMLLDSNSLVLDPTDFALPHMAFDTNDIGVLMVDHLPTRAQGHQDGATLTNLEWGSHGAHPDACTLDTGRQYRDVEPDMMGAPADTQRLITGAYKDLLKLSLELVEDREILDTQAPLPVSPSIAPPTCSSSKQHRPINRVLNQSARLWDIVKAMSLTSQESSASCSSASSGCGNASRGGGNGGSGSQTRSTSTSNEDLGSNFPGPWLSSLSSPPTSADGQQDHLLMVNLVTTYVNLLRNCRAVFVRLHHAVQHEANRSSEPNPNAMLSLPSLQFGEFQLENNVSIQVKVFIELASGMLQRIGNALGINKTGLAAPSGALLTPDDQTQNYRLPFLNDPIAVSTREIILSQESMQGGIHGGDPPLANIMDDIKRLLEAR